MALNTIRMVEPPLSGDGCPGHGLQTPPNSEAPRNHKFQNHRTGARTIEGRGLRRALMVDSRSHEQHRPTASWMTDRQCRSGLGATNPVRSHAQPGRRQLPPRTVMAKRRGAGGRRTRPPPITGIANGATPTEECFVSLLRVHDRAEPRRDIASTLTADNSTSPITMSCVAASSPMRPIPL